MSFTQIAPSRVAPALCECGGVCETKNINFTLRRSADSVVLLQNIAAEVCTLCGEPQFSIETTEKMMRMLHSKRNPDGVMLVPVYDMESA